MQPNSRGLPEANHCRRAAAIMLLLLGIIAADHGARADDDDDDDASRVVRIDGVTAVHLGYAMQEHSGVQIARPGAAVHRAEVRAWGSVVDLQPLIDLRAQFTAAESERQVARAALNASDRGLDRLRALHGEGGNISDRQLQEARARREVDAAQAAAAEARMREIRARAQQQWGSTLVAWALDGSGDALEPFIAREEALLLVVLPFGEPLREGTERIFVSPDGARGTAVEAALVSAAPILPAGMQGESWFFRAAGYGLRIGTRLSAWIPASDRQIDGVLLPAPAVIWHAGQRWVYLRRDGEWFVRRRLPGVQAVDGGWFVAEPDLAHSEIAIAGAQMLLSEEFRQQIPDEDDVP
jgi:hypothetical protein